MIPRRVVFRGFVSIGVIAAFVVTVLSTKSPAVLAVAVALVALGNAVPAATTPRLVPAGTTVPPSAAMPEVTVTLEATNRIISGTGWRGFAVNLVSNLGLWGGIALLAAWSGDLDSGRRALVVGAFALPAGVALLASGAAIVAVMRGESTEFEAHLLVRSAALTLAAVVGAALVYGVGELIVSAPALSAWWVVGLAVAVWSLSLQVVRRQMLR